MTSNLTNKKFIIIGTTASLALLAFYFAVLSLANSFSHAVSQFSQMWYWILLLVAGFGLQAGLYFFIKERIRSKQVKSSTVAITASGGISTGSMIACCLHHLADILPLMGLTAAAVFLVQYQLLFIIIGILSNFIGIIIMLEVIQKNDLAGELFKKILIFDMGELKKKAIGLSFVLFLITFLMINNQSGNLKADISSTIQSEESQLEIIPLSNQTNNQNEVSFSVTPLDFNFDNPVSFEVEINTHSVSLEFDMTEISILEDDKGNKFQPLKWEGSPSGGHHRSGILFFPALDSQTKEIKLTIEDFSKRIFSWKLK
ncbi:MAG: hypothetical protein KJI70_01260 [Patescibacteria group bacterium]|nr:hypothetical protein [Patescibacteria group bacterium]